MSEVIDRGTHDEFAISKIGSHALDQKPTQRLYKDIEVALLPMVADMIQTSGGVFAAMSDTNMYRNERRRSRRYNICQI